MAEPGFPGVAFSTDAVQTMRLAKRLRPQAKRVVLVSGVSDFDRSVAREAERELADSGLNLEREVLYGLTPQALFAVVEALPAGHGDPLYDRLPRSKRADILLA